MAKESMDQDFVGDGRLGEFDFDDGLMRDLGATIVTHTQTVIALIRHLAKVHEFPGLRYQQHLKKLDFGTTFIFNGTDLDAYIRSELNQIRQIIFAFKIEI